MGMQVTGTSVPGRSDINRERLDLRSEIQHTYHIHHLATSDQREPALCLE